MRLNLTLCRIHSLPPVCRFSHLRPAPGRGYVEIRDPPSIWQPLRSLRNGSIDNFRNEAFIASVPVMLPKGHFRDYPAIHQWFVAPEIGLDFASFNYPYLRKFDDAIISQEYTSMSGDRNTTAEKFSSMEAPLSIFLDWAQRATFNTKDRLYIAQASISVLPSKLKDDIPTPNIVAKAGRGDIYDASIWMGVPPTYTPLHRDPNPNLLVQLAGRKIVRLLPPNIGHEVFAQVRASIGKPTSSNIRGEEMMIGEEKRLLDNMIWNKDYQNEIRPVSLFEAQLDCGDAVFIPKGWWHSVKGVGKGITASVCYTPLLFRCITKSQCRSIGGSDKALAEATFEWFQSLT